MQGEVLVDWIKAPGPSSVQTTIRKQAATKDSISTTESETKPLVVQDLSGEEGPTHEESEIAGTSDSDLSPPLQLQNLATGNTYFANLLGRFRKAAQYPPESRRRKETGVVEISLFLSKQGVVSSAQIHRSSQVTRLDQAALSAAQNVGKLPPIPDEIAQTGLRILVPFDFRLL